jgi:Dolichyl-phosphate-mannose-protein mannosyltransferase
LNTTDTPTGLRRTAPWLGLAGLAALWVATSAMARHSLPVAAVVALGGGLLAWIAAGGIEPPADDLGGLDPPSPRPRIVPLIFALVAAGICWWRMPAEEFHRDGVVAWLAAVALWLAAWWPSRRPPAARAPDASGGRTWAVRLTFLLILGIGAWFHFHELARVPANPVSDHAEEMLDLNDLLHGQTGIYFFRNLGIPPFPHYWDAAFLRVTGLPLRFLSIKAATASFGLLLVPALYVAGNELGGPLLGLAAAAFAAWGKWPVSLARQGQGYIFSIPIATFVVWALLRWLRRDDRSSMLATGVVLGAGMATYQSFRVVPLVVPLAVLVALADPRRRGRRWRAVGGGALAAATSAVVFLPVLKFAVVGPQREFFWSRVLTRATDVERALAGKRSAIFAGNLWNMAKAFQWEGASTWNILAQYEPFLDVVAGAAMLAGLVLALRAALVGGWRWAWLLALLFVLTLPSTLVFAYPNENPSLNRAGTAVPVVFLLVGLPFAWLARGFMRERLALRTAGIAALFAAAAVSLRQNAEAYFVRLGIAYDAVIEHAVEVAAVLRQYRAQGIPLSQQYLLSTDYWMDARSVGLELGDPAWAETHNIPPPFVPDGLTARPLVFVYRANDADRLGLLKKLYPEGRGRIFPQSHPDRNFGVYLVPSPPLRSGPG